MISSFLLVLLIINGSVGYGIGKKKGVALDSCANAPPATRAAELLGFAHNVAQSAKQFALLSDEQFRITDDVDEKDVPDLKFHA